jgi:hypothetical protein
MNSELICGLECFYPDIPINGIENNNDVFTRTEIPSSFNKIELDQDGNYVYTDEQLFFIKREILRCRNGYWFINNGVSTFITGAYYYFLNYYTLEDGIKPEYRDSSRRHFLFYHNSSKNPKIFGHVRLKARRQGATSEACCLLLYSATFNHEYVSGILSFNDALAEIAFQSMVRYAFFKLPSFLKPRVDKSSTSKKDLVFLIPPERGKNAEMKIEGLNSRIDYQPLTSTPYDSRRVNLLLFDESGKVERHNINKLWSVVKECVKKGASKIGYAIFPTTVGEANKGGDNFKELWNNSSQYDFGLDTPSGLIQYFVPSYEGLEGFIDKHGFSVVEEPDVNKLEELVEIQSKKEEGQRIPIDFLKMGARKYLSFQLEKLKSDTDKADFKRKYPITPDDSFDFGNAFSPFNLENIKEQEIFLRNNPIPLRRGKFSLSSSSKTNNLGDLVTDYNVFFEDSVHGNWLIYALPEKENNFEVDINKKIVRPLNTTEYCIGADTFRSDDVQSLGSKGSIVVMSKFDPSREDGGGIVQATYLGRPKLAEFFFEEILLASLYYGCIASVENDATNEYRLYFANRVENRLNLNCLPLLGRKPDSAIDPLRAQTSRNMLVINSSDPFIFSKQIELGQKYFQRYTNKIYFPELLQQAREFNVDKRTKSDLLIGFLMALLGVSGQSKAKAMDYVKGESLIRTYEIKGSNY